MLNMRSRREVLVPSILVTLGAFASACLSSIYVYLIEQAVCRKHFLKFDPAIPSSHGLVDEESCKIPDVQAQVASINGIYTFLACLPAFFFTAPYRQLARVLGRKLVILMNICGFAIDSCFFIAVCYFYTIFDIRWIYLAPFLWAFGGGTIIFQSLIYTCISESVESKHLSGVLYKLRAAQLFATFFAMALSSYLLRKKSLLQDHVQTAKEKIVDYPSIDPDAEDSEESEIISLLTNTPPPTTGNTSILVNVGSSLLENMSHTITLFKSIIRSSPFCRTTMLTYFLFSFANAIDDIFAQWSSLTFSWILADVNAVNSLRTLVSFIVLLSLPTLSSIVKPHFGGCSSKVDLFMVNASVIACGVGILFMALAPTRELLILARVSGLLGGKDEIEQFYVGVGIMETVGGMLGTVAWSAVFREVVGVAQWILRVPYGLCAVLMVGVLGCIRVEV
ncbi:hypothetical protein N431DRAFT_491624 [Stipitochalara longipes BDJ]|nr:hypothetical protein N431DRAFT_491624 [Stipitochalara longipes BDJ]